MASLTSLEAEITRLKKLIPVVILVAVGYFVYVDYIAVTTPRGAVDTAVAQLDERLQEAVRGLNAARRAAGVSGIDMSDEGRAARDEIQRIERQIEVLRRRSTAPEEIRAVDAFQLRVDDVKDRYRLE